MNDQIQQEIDEGFNRSSLKYEQQQKKLWVTGLLVGLTFFCLCCLGGSTFLWFYGDTLILGM